MLPKKHRLTSRYDFNKTRFVAKKNKTRLFGDFVDIFYYAPFNYDGATKIGIVVSNRVSKSAVRRNRIKRIIREVFRTWLMLTPQGLHLVVQVKPGLKPKDYEKYCLELNSLLQKLPLTR